MMDMEYLRGLEEMGMRDDYLDGKISLHEVQLLSIKKINDLMGHIKKVVDESMDVTDEDEVPDFETAEQIHVIKSQIFFYQIMWMMATTEILAKLEHRLDAKEEKEPRDKDS